MSHIDDVVEMSISSSDFLNGVSTGNAGNFPVSPARTSYLYGDEDVVVEESFASGEMPSVQAHANRKKTKFGVALLLTLLLQTKPYLVAGKRFIDSVIGIVYFSLGLDKAMLVLRRVTERVMSRKRYIAAATLVALGSYIANQKNRKKNNRKAKKVAIVGSGVAGSGAAWALRRAGVEVVVYEKKPKVGGNAKSMNWNVEGKTVETGLAVFAWPQQLFHNYNALVDELDIETEDHDTRFFVAERDEGGDVECVFAHGKPGWKPKPWLKADLIKWDSMCAFIKRVNGVLQPAENPSIYRMGFLNPLNAIPLRLLCRIWGISDKFWNFVFVPIHTSTFLEIEMDTLPASMAEVLDDIVPFTKTPNMRCWKTHAYDAILKMLQDIPQENIRTSCAVETVKYYPSKNAEGFDIKVIDEDNNEEEFDGIIYACSAQAMNRILHGKGDALPGQTILPNNSNGLNNTPGLKARLFNWLETTLLSKTLYTTDRDKTFERGVVHSDGKAVLPEKYRGEVLDTYCNYIEVDGKKPSNLENSFVISSWAPSTQTPEVRGKLPMLVTYNAEKKLENVETEWVSTSREAHPCLTTWQCISSVMLWPFLQGARNEQTYFCGSAVLPGNGHDLSFLSGLVAASELGAPYPFINDKKAFDDYNRLRSMMLSIWA